MSGCCSSGCASVQPTQPNTNTKTDYRWHRIGLGLLLAANGMVVSLAINSTQTSPRTWHLVHLGLLAISLLIVALLGPSLISRTWSALRKKRLTTETLFVAAISAAMAQSTLSLYRGDGPTYFEISGLLLVVYSIGIELNGAAKQRALKALDHLRPDKLVVDVVTANGLRATRVDQLELGAVIRAQAGQLIAVDGQITHGSALLREAELTGEPIASRKIPGDRVIAGTQLLDASIDIRVEAISTRLIDRVSAAIESVRRRPSSIERLADQVASKLFPIVVLASLTTLLGWATLANNLSLGIENALAVLLIACPCALGFATPLVLWRSTARLAQRGLKLQSGEALEALAATDTIVFDKTGTLTLTNTSLSSFTVCNDVGIASLKGLIAAVERKSDHPFAAAFASLDEGDDVELYRVDEVQVVAGQGITASVYENASGRNHRVAIGPASVIAPGEHNIETIAIMVDGVHRALAEVGETLRPGSLHMLRNLADEGYELHLLSGDRGERVAAWNDSSFTSVQGDVGPIEKQAFVEKLRKDQHHVLFIGDGVNDAATLASADVGISMQTGTELALESADGSLGDDLSVIGPSIDDARRSLRFAQGLVRYAIIYNAVGIVIASLGLLHPVVAAVLMATSSVAVTLRAAIHDERPQAPHWQTEHWKEQLGQAPTHPQHPHPQHQGSTHPTHQHPTHQGSIGWDLIHEIHTQHTHTQHTKGQLGGI